MNKQHVVFTAVLFTLAGLAGCTHLGPSRVEADYGLSHRLMLSGQLHDPAAADNPSTEAPIGLDGDKAVKVLEAYREDNADREPVNEPISIDILNATRR